MPDPLTPTPPCCEYWPLLLPTLKWYTNGKTFAMPCIEAGGRDVRVQYCPSCGQPRRHCVERPR